MIFKCTNLNCQYTSHSWAKSFSWKATWTLIRHAIRPSVSWQKIYLLCLIYNCSQLHSSCEDPQEQTLRLEANICTQISNLRRNRSKNCWLHIILNTFFASLHQNSVISRGNVWTLKGEKRYGFWSLPVIERPIRFSAT